MSRRGKQHDPGFGTESFMDVLSNVVGILIILIVLAGMQLGRAPSPGVPVIAEDLPPTTPAVETAQAEVAVPADDSEMDGDEPDSDTVPTPLAYELQAIEAERTRLEAENARAQANLAELLARRDDAQSELSKVIKDAEEAARRLDDQNSNLIRVKVYNRQRRQALSGLLAEFEESSKASSPAQTIKHRLTPVSQEVTGEEIHLRLDNNRVSVVPLGELLERVKQQVERRRGVAMTHGGYKGIVGPVDGYSLEFLIEARKLNPHEERQMGLRDGYSLELSRCVVVPAPTIQGETAEEALQRSSRFAMALRTAGSGATITMWTYPDSFGLFRKLQEAGQSEGFLVAARPMPKGTPIMGDRRLGTRSAAQ